MKLNLRKILLCLKIIPLLSIGLFLTACNQQQTAKFTGYVDADYIYISSNLPGELKQISVARGMQIKSGQPLFTLEAQPESDQEKNARAAVLQALADEKQKEDTLNFNSALLTRHKKLFQAGAVSKEDVDTTQNNYNHSLSALQSAQANVSAMQANLNKAEWERLQKVVVAPVDGLIYEVFYTTGELVESYHPILSILTPGHIKIVFYAPETFLGQMRPGQKINITCDNCAKNIIAKINYISPQAEYTPPLIYSEDNRTKLVYRIEAAPVENALYKLYPGQPITAELTTR